jgi:hypothetical protein
MSMVIRFLIFLLLGSVASFVFNPELLAVRNPAGVAYVLGYQRTSAGTDPLARIGILSLALQTMKRLPAFVWMLLAVSAVTQSAPRMVGIEGFKVHHF